MNQRIENLLSQLTLEEKISMLAGVDMWTTQPIERLGIPAIKVTDGPNGARGAEGDSGPTSVCFPVGVALGATWNPSLIERVGKALAEETKAKGAHILLAPTVNIHRSPLAGRNFECYSEDPYLTSRMAVAYIKGLQSQGVGACIKHFVCNDSEFERFTMSSQVSERALREIYLPPFRAALREAKPWSVMSAYNKINDVYASENTYTLLDILKGEWGFDGIVISDWFGTYSPDVANGGLDLEMPGPARWMGDSVLQAVREGKVPQDTIDDKIRRLLRTIIRAGAFEQPELNPEQAIDKPEHRRLVREAAGEAIVLLKNASDLLPLDPDKLNAIAVIGANAKWAQIKGGGSSNVTPHYVVSPLQGITDKVGDRADVTYAIGCPIHKSIPPLDAGWLRTGDGERNGFSVQLFDDKTLSGDPVATKFVDRTQISWSDGFVSPVDPLVFSARLSATLVVPESGTYTLSLTGNGLSRLFIDGQEIIDNWSDISNEDVPPWDRAERDTEMQFTAGQPYQLKMEYGWEGTSPWRVIRVGCLPPLPSDTIKEAVSLAARSDVAIVFAGQTNEWESEGHDRQDMELRGDQVELIERVAAANPNTVVVLNTGSPVTMDWLDAVPAVAQAWFAGQEAGNAIADVLFGDVNPSGKLPTTFPKRLQDNPAYINYPGENGRVHYGEGIFVGYRYYDKKEIAPLFPFGYGLSYTSFAYRGLSLSATQYAPGDQIQVSVEIENTGERAGKEVVQLYVRDVASSLVRPEKELKAFAKVALEPGELKTISFTLDSEALACYDDARAQWVIEAGAFEVLVGGSSRDIYLSGSFELSDHLVVDGTTGQTARLHIGLALGTLLDDERGRAVLEKHFGAHLGSPQLQRARDLSLQEVARFAPEYLTQTRLEEINDDLAAV